MINAGVTQHSYVELILHENNYIEIKVLYILLHMFIQLIVWGKKAIHLILAHHLLAMTF